MDTPDRLLVVDDDRDIRTLLAEQLGGAGFDVATAADGVAMRKVLDAGGVDLIVLDLNLPDEDGLALCRQIRARGRTPIVMLTARGDPIDRIVGLELGADDYVPKPFEPRELIARIRSVLRRTQALPENFELPERILTRFGAWRLDHRRRHLIDAEDQIVMLSGAEYRLLAVFTDHPNRVLSREQLHTLSSGRNGETVERSIDLQVSRLRQKLGDDAKSPELIKTVRGGGYVLAIPVINE